MTLGVLALLSAETIGAQLVELGGDGWLPPFWLMFSFAKSAA